MAYGSNKYRLVEDNASGNVGLQQMTASVFCDSRMGNFIGLFPTILEWK